MRFLHRLFGSPTRSALQTVPDRDIHRDQSRHELLAASVRHVLQTSGIPPTWISARPQLAWTPSRSRGAHLRLVVTEWRLQLIAHAVPIENAIRAHLARRDPQSITWLAGISWSFDIADVSSCPAMPPPRFWVRQQAAPPHPATMSSSEVRRMLDRRDEDFSPASARGADFPHTQPMLPRETAA